MVYRQRSTSLETFEWSCTLFQNGGRSRFHTLLPSCYCHYILYVLYIIYSVQYYIYIYCVCVCVFAQPTWITRLEQVTTIVELEYTVVEWNHFTLTILARLHSVGRSTRSLSCACTHYNIILPMCTNNTYT